MPPETVRRFLCVPPGKCWIITLIWVAMMSITVRHAQSPYNLRL
jgi:hypothetical protein